MTTSSPVVGIKTFPLINNTVSPTPDSNNSLPPRTNLTGYPSAFRDSISGSGGDDIDQEGPPDQDKSKKNKKTVREWLDENKTALLMMGVVLFVFAAAHH